jgi:predicted acyltransferase
MAFSMGRMLRRVLVRSLILIFLGGFLMDHGKPKSAWTLVNTLSQIGLSYPLVVAGSNSIALYLLSQLLRGWTGDLWLRYLGKDVFQIAGPLWEPVLKACAIGLSFWLVCLWMWRNRFFVKI